MSNSARVCAYFTDSDHRRLHYRHRMFFRSVMTSVREMFQFISYWVLTYWYGVMYTLYIIFSFLVGKYRKTQTELLKDREELQPSCLSDPIYGSHKFIKVQGVKLHYVESGESNPQIVILIHGTPGFWFCWRKQIPILAPYFRVIAVDLRGCGDSDSPTKRGSFSKDIVIQDIVLLINALGCSPVHIICCETSGHIVWDLASRHPQQVSKLVFINAPHPLVVQQLFHTKSYSYFKYWYLLFLQIPILPQFINSSQATTSWIKSVLEPTIKSKAISKEEIEAYNYTFSRQEDWRGVLNHLKLIDLRPLSEKPQPSIITVSSLLLMGSDHPHIVSEAAYRSAELAERIQIRIVSDAGNNLQVTHPKRVNDELCNFLVGPNQLAPKKVPQSRQSLVGRMLGVVSPYTVKNTDVLSISNGLKEVAQNTLYTGKNLAQTVWQGNNKENYDISQLIARN